MTIVTIRGAESSCYRKSDNDCRNGEPLCYGDNAFVSESKLEYNSADSAPSYGRNSLTTALLQDSMAWDIRRTYYYLVCFATLLMMIIGSVQVVQSTLDLVMPEEYYRPTPMEMYQRHERPGVEQSEPPFSREELQEMSEEEAERMERQARRRALRSLLGNLALVLIAAPVYMYHWKKVRADEQNLGQ